MSGPERFTPAWIAWAGQTLYGRRFRAKMARALGIDERTLRGYLEEPPRTPVPPHVYLHTDHLLALHRAGLPITEK